MAYLVNTRMEDNHITIPAPTGDGYEKTYRYEISKDGKKELVEDGKENVYEMIQSSLEGTKIENIIKRYTMGDETALEAVRGTYGDVTALPKTLMELNNMMLKAQNDFALLPLDIRKQFDHSLDKYITMMGSPEWLSIMGATTKTESEVKTDEPRE